MDCKLESKLQNGTLFTLTKSEKQPANGINIGACKESVAKCEELIKLCKETNLVLSPFFMIHFIHSLILMVAYGFLASRIFFATFHAKFVYQVSQFFDNN